MPARGLLERNYCRVVREVVRPIRRSRAGVVAPSLRRATASERHFARAGCRRLSVRRSVECFRESDEQSLGSSDVAEPIRVFVLDHFLSLIHI